MAKKSKQKIHQLRNVKQQTRPKTSQQKDKKNPRKKPVSASPTPVSKQQKINVGKLNIRRIKKSSEKVPSQKQNVNDRASSRKTCSQNEKFTPKINAVEMKTRSLKRNKVKAQSPPSPSMFGSEIIDTYIDLDYVSISKSYNKSEATMNTDQSNIDTNSKEFKNSNKTEINPTAESIDSGIQCTPATRDVSTNTMDFELLKQYIIDEYKVNMMNRSEDYVSSSSSESDEWEDSNEEEEYNVDDDLLLDDEHLDICLDKSDDDSLSDLLKNNSDDEGDSKSVISSSPPINKVLVE